MRRATAYVGLAAALVLAGSAEPARPGVGSTFAAAWQCAKGTVKASGSLAEDLYKKGEALASMSAKGSVCAANASTDQVGFAVVSGAIIALKVASPSSLPTGQCLATLQTTLAKPFAMGLSAVVPIDAAKTQLMSLANSEAGGDYVWSQMQTSLPPPVNQWMFHADCACSLMDQGLTLADLSAIGSAIRQTSDSCASVLDESGFGFINDWGGEGIGYVSAALGAISTEAQKLQGVKDPAPDETVYWLYFRQYTDSFTNQIIVDPKGGFAGVRIPGDVASTAYYAGSDFDLPEMVAKCQGYYADHLGDEGAKCDGYHDRFVGEVSAQVSRVKADKALDKVVEKTILARFSKDWDWRMFNAYTESGEIFAANMGGYYKKATGVYKAAHDILPYVNYDTQRAADLAYAGIAPKIQQAIRKVWDKDRALVRDAYLKKLAPTQPMEPGPYGCPNPNTKLGASCVANIEGWFDVECHPKIADAHSTVGSPAGLIGKLGPVIGACTDKFRGYAELARALSKAPPAVATDQQGCADPDRVKAAACATAFSEAWDLCAIVAYDNGHGVPHASACYSQKAASLRRKPLIILPQPQGRPTAPPTRTPAPPVTGGRPAPPAGRPTAPPPPTGGRPRPIVVPNG